MGTGERGEVAADNRGGQAQHSGEKRGGGIVNRGGRAIHQKRSGDSYSQS